MPCLLAGFIAGSALAAPTARVADFTPSPGDAPTIAKAVAGPSAVVHQSDPGLCFAPLVPQKRIRPGQFNVPWGVTASESPSLFWFSTKPTPFAMETEIFSVNGKEESSIWKATLRDPLACGIQRLNLRQIGVKLQAGQMYRWQLRYVDSEGNGLATSAYLIRLPGADPRVAAANAATAIERANVCAAQGIWFDMLEALCDAIEQNPSDGELRQARLAHLENRTTNLTVSAWIDAAKK